MTLVTIIFYILWILLFFAASIWCMQVALIKSKEFIKNQHWFVKLQWWYGLWFSIFLVGSIFFSFVVLTALLIIDVLKG